MSKKVDLTQENIIECVLKRKGGTLVNFGFHNRKKSVYHFQPLDPNDPDSPHVCNVENEEHYERFVNIPEAYREFFPDEEYEPVVELSSPAPQQDYDPRNDFNDLLSVNPEDVSNDWLEKFTKTILGITLKQKQELADYLKKTYGEEPDYKSTTAAELARLILKQRIQEEQNASDAAE